jgi:zeaxanthin glucosyltransferase
MPPDCRRWHFGVLSFTGTGHLNPFIALSQELKNRGHRVTFFAQGQVEDRIRRVGLDFVPIPAPQPGKPAPLKSDRPGILHEIALLRFHLQRIVRELTHYLASTPAAISAAGVDALLIDEIALTGPTVAELLSLPYFLISTSVPHHFGWKSSSWLTGYRYSPTVVSWLQGWFLEVSALRMRGPLRRILQRFRRRAGLAPVHRNTEKPLCLAHITQLAECLDLPRKPPSGNFYYTAPWLRIDAQKEIDFPWDRLDGRPLVYATMGTTRSVQSTILEMIAEACSGLDVQLVISLGNRFDPEQFDELPGRPLVVTFAPQLEILKRADLAIVHGGANTAFEALMEGKPMVAIPQAFDQPAVAARLKRLKVAEVLPVMRLSVERIRRAVAKVLNDPQCREAAGHVQLALRSTQGAKRAADIIAAELSGHAAQQRALVPAGRERTPANSHVMGASYLPR